ncbi:hypothetical protein [Mycetocola sp.]|uniref:hypothetical protein n=1 Tax=Mycetocola sp. TaxID=1871042 RepID=UPI003989F68C
MPTIAYAGEPVWAGSIGRIAGEQLPAIALIGTTLIVAGLLVKKELTPAVPPQPRQSFHPLNNTQVPSPSSK